MNIRNTQLAKLFTALCLVAPIAAGSSAQAPVRTIEIHAHRYAFEPAEITIRKGEKVQLKLISDDVPHSLLVSDLGINEAATKSHPGEAILTATNVGDFRGRCGRFCGSGHGRMLFTVHVIGN